jgi:DNA-3-methyladenine glycosylase
VHGGVSVFSLPSPDRFVSYSAVSGSQGTGGRGEAKLVLLPRETFARSAVEVAPALLGCVLERDTPEGLVAVALTEVEAYHGEADPASHAYRGKTLRNAVMFGPPGHAYVYFTYGMHFCVNLVCLPEGAASAVLLRAGRVVEGEGLAIARRTAPGPAGRDLARGPARLCQALAITRAQDGADVCDPASPLRVRWPGPAEAATGLPGASISHGPRVGVSAAADLPWRFWVTGDPTVSAYRAHAPRRARPKPVSARARSDGTIPL